MLKRFLDERQDPTLKCERVGHALCTVRKTGVMSVAKWHKQDTNVIKHFNQNVVGVRFVVSGVTCTRCGYGDTSFSKIESNGTLTGDFEFPESGIVYD